VHMSILNSFDIITLCIGCLYAPIMDSSIPMDGISSAIDIVESGVLALAVWVIWQFIKGNIVSSTYTDDLVKAYSREVTTTLSQLSNTMEKVVQTLEGVNRIIDRLNEEEEWKEQIVWLIERDVEAYERLAECIGVPEGNGTRLRKSVSKVANANTEEKD